MPDREKVMLALNCCAADDFRTCRECPYAMIVNGNKTNSSTCVMELASDALDLLEEQEPRVLTVEEIRSGTVEVAWIEDVDKAEVIPGIWFRLSNEGEDEAVDIHIRDGFVGARLEVYGKLWRCWTSRPSPEQMRDTKWEGEDNTRMGEDDGAKNTL